MPPATYRNPVLPGFAADPSVCRVGRDCHLVNSSFEFFPGLPIHHSRDLVHWRLIGHALTREGPLPLHGRGSFLLQAKHAAGPWSDPIWLDEPVFGMDPSLFFDDDGLDCYTRHGGGERGGVDQALLAWPEGPHLYRRGDGFLGVHLGLFVEEPAAADGSGTPTAFADFAGLRLQPEPDDARDPPSPPQSRA